MLHVLLDYDKVFSEPTFFRTSLTSAYVGLRRLTSAYVGLRRLTCFMNPKRHDSLLRCSKNAKVCKRIHFTAANV